MRTTRFIWLVLFSNLVSANTIRVHKSGKVSSLRKAVELARDGDTILLHEGIYKEGTIVIKKSIRLIGVGNPVLDGENKHEILTISGSRIIVRGIHFKNSGYS